MSICFLFLSHDYTDTGIKCVFETNSGRIDANYMGHVTIEVCFTRYLDVIASGADLEIIHFDISLYDRV